MVGYIGMYIPEKASYATVILPIRVLGLYETQDITEYSIFGMYYTFCRDCLSQDLQGRYY